MRRRINAHDQLAEFGFRNHQRAQALRGNNKRLDRALRRRVHQRRKARQLRQFAQKVALLGPDHQLGQIQIGVLRNGNPAGKDNHEARSNFARGHDPLPSSKGADFAEPPHALDLQGIEFGDYLIAAVVDDRWRRYR